jgi:hypothetical protein
LILGTKKQEGVAKVAEQIRTLALRAELDRGRRVVSEFVLLRELRESFLLLRAEMPLPSFTRNIAALAPTQRTPGRRTECSHARRSLLFVTLAEEGRIRAGQWRAVPRVQL